MVYSSKQFAKQAKSDLGQAQAIARENRSGEALGTAMFLAQQSMEKQFKSTLLKICEAMKADLGEEFFKKTLNHVIHHNPGKFYRRCLMEIGCADGPALRGSAKTRLEQHEDIGKIWDSDFYNFEIQSLLFRYFLLAPMKKTEYERLDSHLNSIFGIIGRLDNSSELPTIEFSKQSFDFPMDRVVLDRHELQEHRDSFAGQNDHPYERHVLEGAFSASMGAVNHIVDRRRLLPKATAERSMMLEVLGYGVDAIALLSPRYFYLLPHRLLGRYPDRLFTGQPSTEIYAAHRNVVLAHLFITVHYDYGQLCQVGERIDDLLSICRCRR